MKQVIKINSGLLQFLIVIMIKSLAIYHQAGLICNIACCFHCRRYG